jgi:hypothetical protein
MSVEILFGEVTDIFNQHITADIEKFPEYFKEQIDVNKSLEEDPDWDPSQQSTYSKNKFVNVVHSSTDFDRLQTEYNNLTNNIAKRKIISFPQAVVYLYQNSANKSIIPQAVVCSPLTHLLVETPIIGQWVSVLKMNNQYFYLPFSFYKDKFGAITDTNTLKNITNGKVATRTAQGILWPREGGSILQNKTGESFLQLDASSFLLSTGFKDLPLSLNGDQVEEQKVHEFLRWNPVKQDDAFIFVDKYNTDWQTKLNNYKKEFYELNKFEDTSVVDKIIADIEEAQSFKKRLKYFFGIDLSGSYGWRYAGEKAPEDVVKKQGSGTFLGGEEIYLGKNTPDLQKDFKAARGEVVHDLLHGMIDIILDMHVALKQHKHFGSPAAVFEPMVDFQQTVDGLGDRITTIQKQLKEIRSLNIHVT